LPIHFLKIELKGLKKKKKEKYGYFSSAGRCKEEDNSLSHHLSVSAVELPNHRPPFAVRPAAALVGRCGQLLCEWQTESEDLNVIREENKEEGETHTHTHKHKIL
jgi:hypothetical protein